MTSGIMLPPELAGLLNTLGFNWPLSDEGKLYDLGGQWSSFGDRLGPAAAEADSLAQQVLGKNSGAAVEQFGTFWSDGDAPKPGFLSGFDVSRAQADAMILDARVRAGWIEAPAPEAAEEEAHAEEQQGA